MFSSAIIVFREALEIALILGVVLAATRMVEGRKRWIAIGFGAGIVGSILIAFFVEAISNAAEGLGQELFNALILLSATAVIGWTLIWMQKHARAMTQHFKEIGSNINEGRLPLYTLAVVVALTILREGSEIVLFTYGMLASGQSAMTILGGSIAGFVAGSIVGGLLYFGLLRIPTRYIFQVTSWLLIFLSAGMASIAAKYLVAAGFFETLAMPVWDTSAIISEQGIIGQALHTLLGYSAQPLGIQVVFYGATVAILTMAIAWTKRSALSASPRTA